MGQVLCDNITCPVVCLELVCLLCTVVTSTMTMPFYSAIFFKFCILLLLQMGCVLGKKVTKRNNNRKGCILNQWDPKRLQAALNEYAAGKLDLRQLSRAWNIPKSTLQRRISGKVTRPGHASGRPTALPPEVERDLADFLRNLSQRGFPVQPLDVRRIAYEYAAKNGISGIGSDKTRIAGRFWFRHYMSRFPDMALHKPEALSAARAMGCNELVLTQWHDLYKRTVSDLQISDRPSHIWNCDESGLQDMFVASKVIGEKGKPSYQVTSGEKGETVTVLAGMNAVGQFTPLLMLFKGKRMKPFRWAVGSPPDTIIRMSDNGWKTSETFIEWGHAFVRSLPQDGLPHLLLLDGHGSHVYNVAFLDLMASSNVQVMCFPSHTTHVLQPADVSLFKSLKANWTSEGLAFNREYGGRKPGRANFFRIFTPSWKNAATVANAQSGFRSTGLFPLDFSAIPKQVFLPSQTTERPLSATETISSTEVISPSQVLITPDMAESSSVSADQCHTKNSTVSNGSHDTETNIGTCEAVGSQSDDSVSAPSNLEEGNGSRPTGKCAKNRFDEILPVPVRARAVSTRKRNKPPSHILSSKQHSDFLQEMHHRKAKKDRCKQSKKMPSSVAKTKGKESKIPATVEPQKSDEGYVCISCNQVFGDMSGSKAGEDWLGCSRCETFYHESCAEECGLVDVKEFICGQCFE